MFMARKMQHYYNVNSPQRDLQIQYNLNQNLESQF